MPSVVIPKCQHIKADGLRCGSPAMRGRRLCYFHGRPRPRPRKAVADVPDPTDAHAVLAWTMQGLMAGTLDPRAAGQLIYGVQLGLQK